MDVEMHSMPWWKYQMKQRKHYPFIWEDILLKGVAFWDDVPEAFAAD